MSPPAHGGSRGGPRAAAAALITALLTLAARPAAGQTMNSWKGNVATDIVWSDPGNWTAQVIATTHVAVFSSNAARVYDTTNDLTNLSIMGILVNNNNTAANPVFIRGNAFGITTSGINMSAATTDLTIITAGLTLAAGQTWTMAAGCTLTVAAPITGTGSPAMTVTGGGTVRLNAGAAGLGNVSVTGGTLVLGSASATVGGGTLTVSGTATLTGVGTIVPNTGTVAGNRVTLGTGTTLAPGIGGVGTLAVGSAATHGTAELDGGSKFVVDLGSAVPRPVTGIADVNTNDRLNVTGILQFATGTSNLSLAVSGAGQTFVTGQGRTYDYVIATGSDGLSGFNPAQVTVLPTNFSVPGTFTVQAWNTNNVLLSFTPVPEAANVLGACAAAVGMGWWVRFWRRRWHAAARSPADRNHDFADSAPVAWTGTPVRAGA
ncbi:MAG TPA: hypothetical protein VGF55_06050 [Gemmataceae bacterium]|jgi:hypothetical protein